MADTSSYPKFRIMGKEFDPAKPDGMMRKLLDSARIRALGWQPVTRLDEGIERTVAWWEANREGYDERNATHHHA